MQKIALLLRNPGRYVRPSIRFLILFFVLLAVVSSSAKDNKRNMITHSIQVSAGWNLMSLPASVSNGNKDFLFPSAVSSAFVYQYPTGYSALDTLDNGMGFWLKFDSLATVLIQGDMASQDTIEVRVGWNIIGSLSVPITVDSIKTVPPGIVTSQFFGYVPGVGYQQADTLQPGQGYWVKVSQNGSIVLSSYTLLPDVKVLPDSIKHNLISISSVQDTLLFEGEIPGILVGQVLVSDTGMGILRRVAEVQQIGGQTRVLTTPASLAEVFSEATISQSFIISDSMVQGVYDQIEGVRLQKSHRPNELQFSFEDAVIWDEDGNPLTTGDQITASGSITVQLRPTLELRIRGGQLSRFLISVEPTAILELNFDAPLEIADLHPDPIKIATIRTTPIVFFVGPVPVVVTNELPIYLGLDGSVKVSLTTGMTNTTSLLLGAVYENGMWSTFSDFNNQFEYTPPSLSAEASLQVYVQPKLEMKLYGVAGPTIGVKGYAEGIGDILWNPISGQLELRGEIYAGLQASIGVILSIFDFRLTSWDSPLLVDARLRLYDWTTVLGGGPPCAGTPTVTYAGKTYNTVQIGSQCWLRENLDVGTRIDGTTNQTNNSTIEKYCYNNNPANCNTYGGLYQWDEAMQYTTAPGVQGICPTGWHIPTSAEFDTLSTTVGGDGNTLKAIGQGTGGGAGTNTSGFSALLAGYRTNGGGFLNLGQTTNIWSSPQSTVLYAYTLALIYDSNNAVLTNTDKENGASVRCLRGDGINLSPNEPSNPTPPDSSTGQSGSPTLSWSCNDPDGDPLTYDVYFGTDNPPATMVSSNQPDTSLARSGLAGGITYYWKIVAKDNYSNLTSGPVWRFTTTSGVGIIPTDYVAYYPFSRNAHDSSENGNSGTVNGATLTKDRWQRDSSAYYFDGSSYIDCNNGTTLQIPGNITVAAWVKSSSSFGVIVNKYSSNGWLLHHAGANTNQFDGRDGTSFYFSSGPSASLDSAWHFLVGQREGDTWKIYVDGSLASDSTHTTGDISNTSNSMIIGRQSNIASQFFTGFIDDIRIYARALSDAEIQALYHENGWSGVGSPCVGTPTVTYAGKTYNTVQIGTQCWLRENLDVGTMTNGSANQTDNGTIEKYCYNNDTTNCNTYGGLYQWNEAMQYSTTPGVQGICPPGWHLPTLSEYQTLSTTVGGDGNALKAIGQGSGGGAGTNTSGFSALLAGFRGNSGNFLYVGNFAFIWSSAEGNATNAYDLNLYHYNSSIILYNDNKVNGFSVRCLKD